VTGAAAAEIAEEEDEALEAEWVEADDETRGR